MVRRADRRSAHAIGGRGAALATESAVAIRARGAPRSSSRGRRTRPTHHGSTLRSRAAAGALTQVQTIRKVTTEPPRAMRPAVMALHASLQAVCTLPASSVQTRSLTSGLSVCASGGWVTQPLMMSAIADWSVPFASWLTLTLIRPGCAGESHLPGLSKAHCRTICAMLNVAFEMRRLWRGSSPP